VVETIAGMSALRRAPRLADVAEIFHFGGGGREPGPDPERRAYGSFAAFSDPDGNSWVLQEVRPGEAAR